MPNLTATHEAPMASLRAEIAVLRDDLNAHLPVVIMHDVLPPSLMRLRCVALRKDCALVRQHCGVQRQHCAQQRVQLEAQRERQQTFVEQAMVECVVPTRRRRTRKGAA